jgi:hypothetical protein
MIGIIRRSCFDRTDHDLRKAIDEFRQFLVQRFIPLTQPYHGRQITERYDEADSFVPIHQHGTDNAKSLFLSADHVGNHLAYESFGIYRIQQTLKEIIISVIRHHEFHELVAHKPIRFDPKDLYCGRVCDLDRTTLIDRQKSV